MPDKRPDKLLGALSLARRAHALAVGFDMVHKAAKEGAAALVLIAADASGGTEKRIRAACENACPVRKLSHSQTDLSQVTKKPAAVVAVTHTDLAALCLRECPAADDEEESL